MSQEHSISESKVVSGADGILNVDPPPFVETRFGYGTWHGDKASPPLSGREVVEIIRSGHHLIRPMRGQPNLTLREAGPLLIELYDQLEDAVKALDYPVRLDRGNQEHAWALKCKQAYNRLKGRLPYVCVSGTWPSEERVDTKAITHTGRFIVDLDHLRRCGMDAAEIRDRAAVLPYTDLAFLSPSHDGVKIIVLGSPVPTPGDKIAHVRAYLQVAKAIEYELGLPGCMIDRKNVNPLRLCYLTYEPEASLIPASTLMKFNLNLDVASAAPDQANTCGENLTNRTAQGHRRNQPRPREWINAGARLTKQGKAWVGPCPHCNGDDRFHVDDAPPMVGGCRKCEDSGDPQAPRFAAFGATGEGYAGNDAGEKCELGFGAVESGTSMSPNPEDSVGPNPSRIDRTDVGLSIVFQKLGIEIRRNVRSRAVEIYLPKDRDWARGLPGLGEWRVLEDDVEHYLMSLLEREFKVRFGQTTWARYLGSLLARRWFDPMMEFVKSCGDWDGVDRIGTAMQECLGAEDTPINGWALPSVLYAVIDRCYEPGADHHTVVTLGSTSGGTGKSAWWKLLVPRGLHIDNVDLSAPLQKIVERANKSALLEVSELAGLSHRVYDKIKALISSYDDSLRLAYGHNPAELLRRWVMVGSVNLNANGVLPEDTSGHRRWLVVPVKKVPYVTVARFLNDSYVRQLWAEAHHRYLTTPLEDRTALHHVQPELEYDQTVVNASHEQRPEGFVTVARWIHANIHVPHTIAQLLVEGGVYPPQMSGSEDASPLREEAIGAAVRDRRSQMALASELSRLGWTKREVSLDGIKAMRWYPAQGGSQAP